MEASLSNKFEDLLVTAGAQIQDSGPVAEQCLQGLKPSLIWIAKHSNVKPPPTAGVLLTGSYGVAVEAVSLVALGLVRPAVLSLRAHYELSLQFLYYRDHPVEWENVKRFRHQPLLPSAVKKYLKDNFENFEARQKLLSDRKAREHNDCYEVLSGVAHGTAVNSISEALQPADLVESASTVSQSIGIFKSVGETLSDINLSCLVSNWLSVPEDIQKDLNQRFTGASAKKKLKFA